MVDLVGKDSSLDSSSEGTDDALSESDATGAVSFYKNRHQRRIWD